MKKFLSVLLLFCFLLTFAACVGGADSTTTEAPEEPTSAAPEETAPVSDDDGLWVAYTLDSDIENIDMYKMWRIELHPDGRARLNMPAISSTAIPVSTYTVEDDLLLIHVPDPESYGITSGDVLARFTILDDSTLVYLSSATTLHADPGRQYIASGEPALTLLSRPN